jgi:hypothetical protein
MARVAGHRGGGSRRRWPWTVAAVALASASAAAARARARRSAEAGEVEPVGDRPDALAAARRRQGWPGANTNATEAKTNQEPDAGPGGAPAATTDSPRSGEPDSA